MTTEAASKSFQPVECIDEGSPDGREIITVNYSQVKGSQLVVSVVDNFGTRTLPSSQDNRYWPALEVTVTGYIQGYSMVLKRQLVRMVSGPLFMIIPRDEIYTALTVRALNMTGGTRGGNQAAPGSGPPGPSAANGFSITCQVQFCAQGGIGEGF
jgi:hypothetical protein